MKTRKEVRNVGTRDDTLTSYRSCQLGGQFLCNNSEVFFKLFKNSPRPFTHINDFVPPVLW